jgi:hypothetical protein
VVVADSEITKKEHIVNKTGKKAENKALKSSR